MYQDTHDELREQLRQDLNLRRGIHLHETILTVLLLSVEHRFAEAAPVIQAYLKFLCPWDGGLHRSEECDKKHNAYLQEGNSPTLQ